MRGGEPDPLGADVVHVGEDCRDGTDVGWRFCWWFRFPGGGVEMFDEVLVHAIVGGKDLDCGWTELRVSFVLKLGHGFAP